jgi:hypothetical protein
LSGFGKFVGFATADDVSPGSHEFACVWLDRVGKSSVWKAEVRISAMSKKRRYLVSAAVLAACACALCVCTVWTTQPQHGLMKATFNRIAIGMTEAEVDAILAQHEEDASRGEFSRRGVIGGVGKRYIVWGDVSGDGAVTFDGNGRVDDMAWNDRDSTGPGPGTIEKLVNWIPLPFWLDLPE